VRFKARWGADERIIRYYKYDLKKNAFMKAEPHPARIYNKLLKKTPIPLLKIFGSLLYKHVG
jgi:hypothetical protein